MNGSTVRLAEVAHARAGDKGSTSIIMLAPYDPDDYLALLAALEKTRLAEHFGLTTAQVSLNPAPELAAVTLVLSDLLAGGVTRSSRIDPHGKALSAHLLQLRVDWPSASG